MSDEQTVSDGRRPMNRMYLLVVILEILVVFGLWFAGRYFGG